MSFLNRWLSPSDFDNVCGFRIDYKNLPEIPCPVCGSVIFEEVVFRFDKGRLVRCSDCRHVYLSPTLTNDILDLIYREYHVVSDDQAMLETIGEWVEDSKGPYQYALDFVERNGGFSGRRVLEIGCGPGRFLRECRNRGAIVTGVDASLEAARLAKEHFDLDILSAPFEQAFRGGRVPIAEFDLVFAFEIIEHVRRPGEFVEMMFQALAPGGWAIFSTPNFRLFYLMGKNAPVVNQWPEHLHFFDSDTLTGCLKRCPFEIVRITTLNPLTYGDRKKQAIARIPIAIAIWKKIRHIRPVYALKDIIFNVADRRREVEDIAAQNGTCLTGIVRKPKSTRPSGIISP